MVPVRCSIAIVTDAVSRPSCPDFECEFSSHLAKCLFCTQLNKKCEWVTPLPPPLVGQHSLSEHCQIPTEETNLDIFRGQEEVIGCLRDIDVDICFSFLCLLLPIFGRLSQLFGDERDRESEREEEEERKASG